MSLLSRREWMAFSAATAAGTIAGNALGAAPSPIRLSLNENAFGPSPRVAPAIARAATGIERYVDQAEVDALMRQIAALERVAPEQVVIGEVLEALGLYLARARPGGGTIVYSAPGYTALVDAAAPLGGRGVAVPLNARLENDLPALAAAVTSQTLAVSLVNPHNPSGTVNDADAFHRFVARAAARTLVVVDEAYLEYDDLAARSAIRHVRSGANVLVFRTLAKIYGLAGMSIGYAVAPVALARGLRAAGIGAPHSLSRPALAAAAAALGDQEYVSRIRDFNRMGRERITARLDALRLRHTDSRANFVFFEVLEPARPRARFDAVGIEIARVFEPLSSWIRVTVGTSAQMSTVLSTLGSM